jgi:hypothetical protein
MTGSCRRLLAASSLIFIFIFAAPTLLHGQDAAADRSRATTPLLAPNLSLFSDLVFSDSVFSDSAPAAPVRSPLSPHLPPRYPGPPGAGVFPPPVFQQLTRAAGIIFSGRVTFIGQAASSSRPDTASTTITFQVEHALRGTSPGQNLTIHEWAGLWSSGPRYRVGERVLLFLYSPSKLGLTSPVAGAMGRFAMDSQGRIVMSALHIANLMMDPILGGRTVVPYADFALSVRRSSQEQKEEE